MIRTDDELKAYFERWGSTTTNRVGQRVASGVLLESYIEGKEFSVETIQYRRSSCRVIGVTTKELSGKERNVFIETGHSFPYVGPECAALEVAAVAAIEALDLDLGAAHIECKIDQGRVRVVEVNPRLAGGKIGSHLIRMATGWDAAEAVVMASLGEQLDWQPTLVGGAAICFLYSDSAGTYDGLVGVSTALSIPGIVCVDEIARRGRLVRPALDNGDYLAEALAIASSAQEALNIARSGRDCLRGIVL